MSVVTLTVTTALSGLPTANTLLWWGHQSTLSDPPQSRMRWETATFARNQVWTRLKAIWLLQSKTGVGRASFDWLNMRWFHSLPLYLCRTTWHLAEDEFAVSQIPSTGSILRTLARPLPYMTTGRRGCAGSSCIRYILYAAIKVRRDTSPRDSLYLPLRRHRRRRCHHPRGSGWRRAI